MKRNFLLISLTCLFVLLLTATAYVSYSGNIDTKKLHVASITPIYDVSSGVKVEADGVIFNDKNQVVDYKIVIENNEDYDVKVTNLNLTSPKEKFLSYEVEGIQEEDIIKANSKRIVFVSFETMGIKGWGRNFNDELTANISFEKVTKQEEVVPPSDETPKEDEETKEETSKPNEDEQSSKPITPPEVPVKDEKELIKNAKVIEVKSITNNTIEFTEGVKVNEGEKIAVWIYSKPIFLGYFNVVVENGVKKIEGIEEALVKADIKAGEHNIVLVSEKKETIGYVPVSITENKEVIIDNNQRDEAIENPYTSDRILLVALVTATSLTGLAIIGVSKNKVPKYMVFVIVLGSIVISTKAEELLELSTSFNVKFESQNIMKPSGCVYVSGSEDVKDCVDYWKYANQIINFYVENEITEISHVIHAFDVTNEQNGRVKAYLVEATNAHGFYDLYLQADGIIYLNEDSSYFFCNMSELVSIVNIEGLDTSKVKNMSYMFFKTGYSNPNLTLDLKTFDTRKVEEMDHMFYKTGYNSQVFVLDIRSFDTRNVTNMNNMFAYTGYNSPTFTLDVSNFDTSNVTHMHYMFYQTGYNSKVLELNLSSFDTSKVINMSYMFYSLGVHSTKLNTSITIKNPNTTSYVDMFKGAPSKGGSQIKVNYTTETEGLAKLMVATKSSNSNVVLGNLIIDADNLFIGDEIHIAGEKFNVISQTNDAVTMFAQYNLNGSYKQTTTQLWNNFSTEPGWEYTPGPKEIDIEIWSTNPKKYINNYVDYLNDYLNTNSIKGDLISLKELELLGCTIPSNYQYVENSSQKTCANSPYVDWLFTGQYWWTQSASSFKSSNIWVMGEYNNFYADLYSNSAGIRPVITISKEHLRNLSK